MTPAMAQSFTLGLQTVPQVVAQQEFQRRLGDLYNGLQSAVLFNQMCTLELQSIAASDASGYGPSYGDIEDSSDDDMDFEQVDAATENNQPKVMDLEAVVSKLGTRDIVPVMRKSFPNRNLEEVSQELENQAALAKFGALKHLQMQVIFASANVNQAYWANEALASATPNQLVVFAVYKEYLNTHALGMSIEVLDAFNFEAFLDDFNDRNNDIADTKEMFAELALYTKWSQLAQLKLQMHAIYVYEQYVIQQLVSSGVSGSSIPTAVAMMETELKVESFNLTHAQQGSLDPSSSSFSGSASGSSIPSGSIDPQVGALYNYVMLASKVLRVASFYAELQVAAAGFTVSSAAVTSYQMLHDGTPSNDEAARQIQTAAGQSAVLVPQAFLQWTNVQYTKFMTDYFLLFLDLYTPQLAAARSASRQQETLLNTNFVQTHA